MVSKVRLLVAVLVIAIIGILIVPPQEDNNEQVIVQSNVIESDDIILDQEIIDQAFQAYSIVETNRVFTESNQSLVEQFLDENDLPSSSEKFGIEVQTVLFDSDQTQYASSSILTIPALELSDSEGRLLDLGSIQTSFLGILSDSNRGSETTFNMEGTVKFYLDDTLITTKKLYASEQGDSRTYELSILDSLPPSSFDRPQAFTFTLSDEGQGWIDGSEHIYRIIITDIDVEISSNKDLEQYTFNGEKIAYELKVTLDENKKVILGEDSYAVSIFKNDSTIQVCGNSHFYKQLGFGTQVQATTNSNNPTVVIKDVDGIPIITENYQTIATTIKPDFQGDIKDDNMSCGSKHCFGTIDTRSCSAPIMGIPRNADIVIEVKRDGETKSYEVHTPKTQFNYYLDQKVSEVKNYKCTSYPYGKCQGLYQVTIPIFEVFTSNFGYNSDDTIWDSAVVRTP
mgnify:CR=1 FL=1